MVVWFMVLWFRKSLIFLLRIFCSQLEKKAGKKKKTYHLLPHKTTRRPWFLDTLVAPSLGASNTSVVENHLLWDTRDERLPRTVAGLDKNHRL